MGQQQLLLLVLATVIVGLATVAGIQAFDEGQTQATKDALTQRGLTVGNQITAALNKPSQLGGVDFDSDKTQIATAAGLDDKDTGGKGISADGAGDDADCDITGTGNPIEIICAENGGNSTSGSSGENSKDDSQNNQTVTVEADLEGASVVSVNKTDLGSI